MKLFRPVKMCSSKTYSNFHLGKHPSDGFPICKGLKEECALSSLHFGVALECAIKRAQERFVDEWDVPAFRLPC
jgi:hypothetical protein